MKRKDEAYKRSAEAVHSQLKELQIFSLKMQMEYGKWLIATLLFLHSAAIGGLFFRSSSSASAASSLWWFVAGILFALAAGFAAFWNFYISAHAYNKMADHRMLNDRKYWPTKYPSPWAVTMTLWLAVTFGVLSVLCLPIGAWFVEAALSSVPLPTRP